MLIALSFLDYTPTLWCSQSITANADTVILISKVPADTPPGPEVTLSLYVLRMSSVDQASYVRSCCICML